MRTEAGQWPVRSAVASTPSSTANCIADPAAPEAIEIVEWADTRHLADLPPQPTYDQTRHLQRKD